MGDEVRYRPCRNCGHMKTELACESCWPEEIRRVTDEIAKIKRTASEKLGQLVTILGINPPGENVLEHWEKLWDAVRNLTAENERLREAFRHTHKAKYDDDDVLMDECARCGLDLRDRIHRRALAETTDEEVTG